MKQRNLQKNIIFFSFYICLFVCIFSNSKQASTNKLEKDIGGSLIDLLSRTDNENIDKSSIKGNNKVDEPQEYQESQTKETDNTVAESPSLAHSPFEDDTAKLRKYGCLTVIIFGTAYLVLRLVVVPLKQKNKFISKGLYSLSNQILILFICYSLLIVFYVYGLFDKIYTDWEKVISAIGVFILCWIVFNIILIVLGLFAVASWKNTEKKCSSFKYLNSIYNEAKSKNESTKEIINCFEYLALKRFFFVPLFPTLKSSCLRKELKLHIYFEYALLKKLNSFFKLTWTSLISAIFTIMFWNVFIINSKILVKVIFIMVIPVLGIAILLGILFYLKNLYRQIIQPINDTSRNSYKDIAFDDKNIYEDMLHPYYLHQIITNKNAETKARTYRFTVHEHLHQRSPSFYEDIIICGQSGFYFILNMIQICAVIFIIWSICLFEQFTPQFVDKYSKLAYIFIILIFFLYLIVQMYLTILTMRWLSMLSSLEMKRDEKSLKKTITKEMKFIGEISEEIFYIFKQMYYEMKTKNKQNKSLILGEEEEEDDDDENINLKSGNNLNRKEFELKYDNLKYLIQLSYDRFNKEDPTGIDVVYELKPFLRSCGNYLSDSEITFILKLIGEKKKVTIEQLNEMCGIIVYFREKEPSKIVKEVLKSYFEENPGIFDGSGDLDSNIIDEFLESKKTYFNENHLRFIKNECTYMGKNFSIDQFVSAILAPRQYYPY